MALPNDQKKGTIWLSMRIEKIKKDIPKSPVFLQTYFLYLYFVIYLSCLILICLFLLPSGKGYNGGKKGS